MPVQSISILYLGALLFSVGLVILIVRRNLILMLMGLELMLNGANLNLAAFSAGKADTIDGQVFVVFIILVAVCEAAVGIAMVLRVYHFYKTSVPDTISELKEQP